MPFTRIVLALLAAALAGAAAAQPAPAEFTIRQSDPPTGSNIRTTMARASSIPINKRYDELTPEQKQALAAEYESIAPGDEPPFPADGLAPLYGAIAQAEQKLMAQGPMLLIATVGADGSVTQVKALASPSAEMTKFASAVLLLTKFKPARCNGAPCRMDYPVRVTFDRK
jgi:hypothetical protein